MKTIKLLAFGLLALLTLTGCMTINRSGGDENITHEVSEYVLSEVIQAQVDDAEGTIVIAEMVANRMITVEDAATRTASFIQSVTDKMEENGYKLMSSDVAKIDNISYDVFVTLVFERKQIG